MPKLNQIIAIVKGEKTKAQKQITSLHRLTGMKELFNGLNRTYLPIDDDGERLPDESKEVQCNTKDVLNNLRAVLTNTFDLVATQDYANCSAKADVVVNDKILLKDVPVTYLLYLEKQLLDIRKFVDTLPELDSTVQWKLDDNDGIFISDPVQSSKTKKVRKNHIMYEATKEHPAQVETYTEDETVGHWFNTKRSGAISKVHKEAILERIEQLTNAVKFARETANSVDVEDKKIGGEVFKFLFDS